MAAGGIDEALVAKVPSPGYVVDERLLEANLKCLEKVQKRTGVKILLALKAFAMYSTFPLIQKYLDGTCASGLHEARLGRETFGKEVHVYAPAYQERNFREIVNHADHVVFNSVHQWERLKHVVEAAPRPVSCGLRVNPEYSEIKTPLYDPCAPASRFGIRATQIETLPAGIEGIHFHCLCEQDAGVLERVFSSFEAKFGHLLSSVKWLNLGGGHLITKPGYDVDALCNLLLRIRKRYGVQIYLEPGEAIALNAGFLVSTVVDIIENGSITIAILDTSATAHMPDVLEMPYRPAIVGAGHIGDFPNGYKLGGISCLAGDVIGDYSFSRKLQIGDRLVFTDMAHYTMVKNNTFNGIPLPAISCIKRDGSITIVKEFGYDDYKRRLS
ncbi:MAG: carboxynorspermidine decarboxylase [Candidatus Lokiarchaeota archaeon]|nr:carboxynorspermidine decarboxylase [Candidatus Lokiarchaeota archaeon]